MSSLRYLEETIHFSTVGAFATMAFEEWNDVPIQIISYYYQLSVKKNIFKKNIRNGDFGLKFVRDPVAG